MRCFVVACAALFSFCVHAATTYYVDNVNGRESYDGLSSTWDGEHGPKAKIQSAVALCEAGDTVVVAPGTYGDDQGKVAAASGYHACRVYIGKAITLMSSGGRDATHVVGKYVNGVGSSDNAVGGIVIAAEAAVGTVVRGFTIRGCGTSPLSGGGNSGGAAVRCTLGASTAMSDMPWIADCKIDDCYSACGAVWRVNMARTFITHCRSDSTPTAAYYCNLAWCVVAHNGDGNVNSHLLQGEESDGSAANYVINCTIQDNARNGTSTASPRYIYNSIFYQFSIYSPILANSVFSLARDKMGNADNPVHVASTNAAATSTFGAGNGVTAGMAANDFRLVREATLENATVADSPALNIGSAALLDVLPEAYRWKDCCGNTVTPVSGKIHAGAVQETMTPVAGVTLYDNTSRLSVNGSHCVNDSNQTIYTDTWPVCYDLKGDDATTLANLGQKPFFGFLAEDSTVPNRFLFPDSNERMPFVPENGRVMKLRAKLATDVLYVDAAAENGVADTGSGTATDPYARIQKALDVVPNTETNLAVIYVAPGTYSSGMYVHGGLNPKSRVCVSHGNTRYRVIGTGRAERTVITGEADPLAPVEWDGCSTNAMRCIYVSNNCTICFQGFTLTGGHTAGGETGIVSGNSYGRGGAMLDVNSERAWLVECIVTNNVAYWAGASFANGVAVKSRFADNRTVKEDGIFSVQNPERGRCIVSSCLVDGTKSHKGALFTPSEGTIVVNSTVIGNSTCPTLGANGCAAFNSIFDTAAATTANRTSQRIKGNVIWNCNYDGAAAGNVDSVNYVKADPLFVDAAGGDFRVSSGSPAVGGGTAWDGLDANAWSGTVAYSNYYRHIACDMDGNMPYFVNGKPTAGAYQKPSRASVMLAAGNGTQISSTASGNAVEWGSEVTVTAVDGVRKAIGISVNGEVMEGVTSYTFTPSLDDHDNGYVFAVVASTNWYVDAENGTSDATGWSTNAALDTLEHVLAKAEAGDTVYALPGNYNAGSMIHENLVYSLWYSATNATVLLPSRAVVPAGVRLVSTDGAEKTFITGEKAATSTGCGDGAMRCVMLQNGAYLKGFTVTGGGTLTGRLNYLYEVFDNVSGGGILCAERSQTPGPGKAPVPVTIVEDCIISNNCGHGSSGATFGSYIHCLFVENDSSGGHFTVHEPQWMYGCVVDDNVVGSVAVNQPYYADFCTFGANNRNSDGIAKPALQNYPGSAFWPVRNCLFLGGANCPVKWAFGCVVPSSNFFSQNSNNGEPTLEKVETGSVAVDEYWRPNSFDAAAVDEAADPAEAENECFKYAIPDILLRDTDFAGGQRIYNGKQDVGAGEFDWRSRYRRAIGGGSRVAVSAASPGVAEALRGVALAGGEELTVELTPTGTNPGTPCKYAVALSGEGTLYLSVNGGEEIVVQTSGEKLLNLPPGANILAFRCSGNGLAVLSDFSVACGMRLIFR